MRTRALRHAPARQPLVFQIPPCLSVCGAEEKAEQTQVAPPDPSPWGVVLLGSSCSTQRWVPLPRLSPATRFLRDFGWTHPCSKPQCSVPPPSIFGCTHNTWKFLGEGSNLSCICNLHHSCGNADSLIHCARPGIEPASPQRQARSLTHSGKSSIPIFEGGHGPGQL